MNWLNRIGNWFRDFLLPQSMQSGFARDHDSLFLFTLVITGFFLVFVVGLIVFCCIRFRRRADDKTTPHLTNNWPLELTWSLIPLAIGMVVFFRGVLGFTSLAHAATDSLDIQVTASSWQWQFDYPNGTRTFGQLHIPVGRDVKLIMISTDVIHSFYLPQLRIKQDVLPNRYVTLAFRAERPGTGDIFCAEFCGRGHSDMWGRLMVETPQAFTEWLDAGGTARVASAESVGAELFEQRSCQACHSVGRGSRPGPSFVHLYGSRVLLANGDSALVDDNFLRQAILAPNSALVAGYPNIMPPYAGTLQESEIRALIAYIKSASAGDFSREGDLLRQANSNYIQK